MIKMNRRNFIKETAAIYLATNLLGATTAYSSARERTMPSKTKKVVVIGAGMAGLTAAQQLQKDGFEVMVIEARIE